MAERHPETAAERAGVETCIAILGSHPSGRALTAWIEGLSFPEKVGLSAGQLAIEELLGIGLAMTFLIRRSLAAPNCTDVIAELHRKASRDRHVLEPATPAADDEDEPDGRRTNKPDAAPADDEDSDERL